MTPAESRLQALARRAVACVPLERWPAGCPVVWRHRYDGEAWRSAVWCGDHLMDLGNGYRWQLTQDLVVEALPDLSSPAGVGCLLCMAQRPGVVTPWAHHEVEAWVRRLEQDAGSAA